MAMATWFLVSALFGLRHGVAPDHLAAVAALARAGERCRALTQALLVGFGHALGMTATAVALILFVHALPEGTALLLDRLAGLFLLLLGTVLLAELFVPRGRLAPGRLMRVGAALPRHPLVAFGLGLLLGLAVSPGDLAIFTLVLRFARTPVTALALLATFLAAMLAVLAGVGAGLGWSGEGRLRLAPWLSGLSGAFGVLVGAALLSGLLG
jgi:hypothetical protein